MSVSVSMCMYKHVGVLMKVKGVFTTRGQCLIRLILTKVGLHTE